MTEEDGLYLMLAREREIKTELLEALREIADGCMNLRPGHVDAAKNRTKAEIESIARAAIAKATGEPK